MLQLAFQLIAPDIVLTANHCIPFTGAIEVGRYNISDLFETGYETYVYQEVVQHPRYFDISGNEEDAHDFALIKIYGTTSDIVPIKLNRDEDVPTAGEELRVIGWGTPDEESFFVSATDVLHEAEVFYVPTEECQAVVEANANELPSIPIDFNVTLCAGDFEELDDTCYGDSGGPIMIKGATSEDDVQVGVTSWGPFDCGHPKIPAFYARISEVKDWIDNNVCRLSLNPPDDFGCAPSSVSNEPDFSGELVEVTIEIQLDTSPQETGWILQSANENDVLVTYGYQPIGSLVNETVGFGESLVTTVLNIPNNRAYIFTVLDAYGDGSDVGITIYQGNESEPLLEVPIEQFTHSFSSDFVLGDPPSRSPTQSPAPTATPMPTSPPTAVPPFVTVVITFDPFPGEVGWLLEALNGESPSTQDDFVVDDFFVFDDDLYGSSGPIILEEKYPGSLGASDNTTKVNLLSPEAEPIKYRFTVLDEAEDGICCAYGDGSYQLWLGLPETGTLLAEGSDFGFIVSHTFALDSNGELFGTPSTNNGSGASGSGASGSTNGNTSEPGSSAIYMRKVFAHMVLLTMMVVQIGHFIE